MRLRRERVERGIKVDRVRLDTDVEGERVERGIKVDRVRLRGRGRGLRGE